MTDAVNIEMTDGTVLESVEAENSHDRAASHQSLAGKMGQDVPVDVPEVQASQAADAQQDKEEAHAQQAVVMLPPHPEEEPEIAAANVVKPDPAREPEPDPKMERSEQQPGHIKSETGAGAVAQLAQEAKVRGGAAATATAEGEAAANASPGERSRYAMLVRDALGPTRPRHEGTSGSVAVTFTLDPAGAVQSVGVVKSSGSPELDEAAMSAVQRTAFPKPPDGMSDAQRSYVVSFDFK